MLLSLFLLCPQFSYRGFADFFTAAAISACNESESSSPELPLCSSSSLSWSSCTYWMPFTSTCLMLCSESSENYKSGILEAYETVLVFFIGLLSCEIAAIASFSLLCFWTYDATFYDSWFLALPILCNLFIYLFILFSMHYGVLRSNI